MSRRMIVAILLLTVGVPALAQQRTPEQWVGTWAAAPHDATFVLPGTQPLRQIENQTIRMIVPASLGGRRVRVRLSNGFGKSPLTLTAVHIARRATRSSIVPGSDRALTFGQKSSFTIPPGARAVSDPVDLAVPDGSDLAISVHTAGKAELTTVHGTVPYASYVSKPGNFTGASELSDATTQPSWYWIDGVEVMAPSGTGAIVAFGDSITDGAAATPDTNGSWPSVLAARLRAAGNKRAVLNVGISGNRVLHDGAGVNALARFDTDVLAQPGVRTMIVLEGINDIGFPRIPASFFGPNAPDPKGDEVSAEEIIGGLRQLIERAHIHGLRVIGGTLTPYEGAFYFSPAGEAKRQAVNTWIRTSKAFDAVIDFDAAVRDPKQPSKFLPELQSGDNLHPSNAGYRKMAEAIDLELLTSRDTPSSR